MVNELTIKGLNPTNNRRLYEIVAKVMEMYQFKKIKVTVKPTVNNAFVVPFFGIYVGQPLLDKLTNEELEGILAHEFSHLFNRDVLSNLVLYVIFAIPALFTIFSS